MTLPIFLTSLLHMVTLTEAAASALPCAAHALPKVDIVEYRKLLEERFNDTRILEDAKKFDVDVDTIVTTFYEQTLHPANIVCIVENEEDFGIADSLNSYGGQKIAISTKGRALATRRDGTFGTDNRLLQLITQAVISGRSRKYQSYCYSLGIERSTELCLDELGNQLKNWRDLYNIHLAKANLDPPSSYLTFMVEPHVGQSSTNLANFSDFYNLAASTAVVSALQAGARQFTVNEDAKPYTIDVAIYDPASASPLYFLSLLDFVEERLVDGFVKLTLQSLSELKDDSDLWTIQEVPIADLKREPVYQWSGDNHSISSVAIGYFCEQMGVAETVAVNKGALPFSAFVQSSRRLFMYNWLAFYCERFRINDVKLLDLSALLKTNLSLDSVLAISSSEKLNADLSVRLTKLERQLINQAQLLNDIREFTARETFEGMIARLQAQIAEVEGRAKEFGPLEILDGAGVVASTIAGIGSLGSGVGLLALLLADIPSSVSGSIDYITARKDDFSKSSEQIGKGVSSVKKLIGIIDRVANTTSSKEELRGLRAQLRALEERYDQVIQDVSNFLLRTLADRRELLSDIVEIDRMRSGTYLTITGAVRDVAYRELIGSRLAGAAAVRANLCIQAAKDYATAPSVTSLAAVQQSCSLYRTRFTESLLGCLSQQIDNPDVAVIVAGSHGVVISRGKSRGDCRL